MRNGQCPAERLGDLARRLEELPREADRLQLGVALAAELVGGCDQASVTMVGRNGVATAAATGELVEHGDRLQYECGQGPCLQAVHSPTPVLSNDLTVEDRWPRWAPRAVEEVGVRSVVSLQLFTSRQSFGSLNLYARQPGSYSGHDVMVAEEVAAQLAVAIAASRDIEQRSAAMATRTVIGQAQGVLMERYSLQPEQAFAYLRRVSQHQNRKLAEVAAELVRTRTLSIDWED